tara:strand:- start:835 stop:1065 length:231 start_codon:yes stop_codon:yes gene_type:complete
MPIYKGKYTQGSDGNYTVDLYTDDTITETHHGVPTMDDAKAVILVWHAQQGYTRPDITDKDFTEDWDNFDSLYVKS